MKKFKIYLDFDGTVVEHNYPKIGRCNFGCLEIIKKLQDAGHEIILNTYRADLGCVDTALNWFKGAWRCTVPRNLEFELKPFDEISTTKLNPPKWDWEIINQTGEIWIDDISYMIPLIPAPMTLGGKMVDWSELNKQFIENGVYE